MPLTTTITTTMDLGWISRSYPSSLLLKSETEAKTEKGGEGPRGVDINGGFCRSSQLKFKLFHFHNQSNFPK